MELGHWILIGIGVVLLLKFISYEAGVRRDRKNPEKFAPRPDEKRTSSQVHSDVLKKMSGATPYNPFKREQ